MPSLILSVSGARGLVGDGLDAGVATRLAAALATLVGPGHVVVGRDSRPSGEHIAQAVGAGLRAVGCTVIDVGIVPTPTVQVAVEEYGAAGGIVVSASHNPPPWNALKFVGGDGQFLAPDRATKLFELFHENRIGWVAHDAVGAATARSDAVELHVARILRALDPKEMLSIRKAKLKVVVDAVRGAGGLLLLPLLAELGVMIHPIDCEADGQLPDDPEPRAEVMAGMQETVERVGAQLGCRTDPDGDRLAIVTPGGEACGEEWTLPLAAWHAMQSHPGPLVTNLSTSARIEWVGEQFGVPVHRTPVGEAHVVSGIRQHGAALGGEGNGGVIDPAVHLGRDAGVALTRLLALEVTSNAGLAGLAQTFPPLSMVKVKLPAPDDYGELQLRLRKAISAPVETIDGLRWQFPQGWVHLRKSGTENVLRIVAEAPSEGAATELVTTVRRAGGL